MSMTIHRVKLGRKPTEEDIVKAKRVADKTGMALKLPNGEIYRPKKKDNTSS